MLQTGEEPDLGILWRARKNWATSQPRQRRVGRIFTRVLILSVGVFVIVALWLRRGDLCSRSRT